MRSLTRLYWLIITAFFAPVEPEVKIKNPGALASAKGGTSAPAAFLRMERQRSFPVAVEVRVATGRETSWFIVR